MAVVLLGGKIPPGRLAKRLTGDEAFCILETIVVDGDRLQNREDQGFIWALRNEFLRWRILNECWNNGI